MNPQVSKSRDVGTEGARGAYAPPVFCRYSNGLVMSKVCYLIQLWGGCEGYLLKALQVQVNRAARSVTGLSGFSSTRKLMEKCGWLTVRQLAHYQTIVMVHKTLMTTRPFYLYSRFNSDFSYSTRQLSTGCIRLDHTYRCRGDLPKNSFRYRGALHYNALPAQIRTVRNMNTFKLKLKRWIRENIEPD